MLKVGITGGIGAGKSTVCALFEVLGIPVLYADDAARLLMETDAALIAGIKALGGEAIYNEGRLDRKALAALVFGNAPKLAALNALVHPATIRHAAAWMTAQTAPYALKEAAIFFESGSAADMDVMIGVSAPDELRMARVMQRAALTREEVLARMAKQLPQDEKMARCDFVITNDDVQAVMPQVLALDVQLRAPVGPG